MGAPPGADGRHAPASPRVLPGISQVNEQTIEELAVISHSRTEPSWMIDRTGAAAAVRVFEHEPDLLSGLDGDTAAVLRRRVVVPQLQLAAGVWRPPGCGQFDGALGLLVLDGVLSRSICLQGRNCAELLGAGDLLRPWDLGDPADAFAAPCAWRVLQPVRLAVLDRRFAAIAARWPTIVDTLLARSTLRSRALVFHLAIAHIRQAETRLLMLFWHLAERWGRMTPDGVVLPLPLTHEMLGKLVCLHRPTTSSALQRLIRAGQIARRADRGWMLLGEPPMHDAAPPELRLAA